MSVFQRAHARLFAACALAGLLSEALLILAAQARAVEAALREDFRVVAALEPGLAAERRAVAEERLLALPGTAAVEYVSPERVVERLAARDPSFPEAVALVGEAPVPGFLEARLADDHVARAAEWASAAESVPELAEIMYSAPAALAAAQLQFYARWLALVLSAAAVLAAGWAASALWRSWRAGALPAARRAWGAGLAGAAGWAAGAAAAALLARPASAWASAWPSAGAQAAALVLAALTAWAWAASLAAAPEPARGRERRAALALAALIAAVSTPAAAATSKQKKRELERLTKELEALRGEAERLGETAEKAERELAESRRREERVAARAAQLRRELAAADDSRRSLGGRLATLDSAREQTRRLLARELGDYARRAPLFASAGTVGVLEDAVRRGAVEAKAAYLDGMGAARERAAGEKAAVERRRDRLSRSARTHQSELERARQSGLRARETYEETSRRIAAAEARIRELEESRAALASLVRDLEKREPKKVQAAYRADPPVRPRSLPWPVPGKVVTGYGKRRVAELDTWTIHNGVEIAAAAGASVRPVLAGEVIYSGPFRSYGNVVIVNHGSGFYSIYGHLRGPLTPKGARALPEAPLGAAAGGKVYLELRQAGRALDPQRWLE